MGREICSCFFLLLLDIVFRSGKEKAGYGINEGC